MRPRPVVIAGPSGVGKGTLIDMLLQHFSDEDEDGTWDGDGAAGNKGGKYFGFSVSHTTRKPRPGEVDGEHYHFTNAEAMRKDIDGGKFVEHAEVHGNLYGTSSEAVSSVARSARICVLDIDVQGVRGVKSSGRLDPHYVFVAPPSMEELERRLRDRGTEKEEDVLVRTKNAAREVEYGRTPGNFDAVIVNGDVREAFRDLVRLMEDWYPHLGRFSSESASVDDPNEDGLVDSIEIVAVDPDSLLPRHTAVFAGDSGVENVDLSLSQ